VKKADATCQCGLATRLVGDGCEHCNPQLAIQLLKEQIADMRLTDAEREAIACAAESYADNDDDEDCHRVAVTLGGLLERTK
jgi:hypothetical protein